MDAHDLISAVTNHCFIVIDVYSKWEMTSTFAYKTYFFCFRTSETGSIR